MTTTRNAAPTGGTSATPESLPGVLGADGFYWVTLNVEGERRRLRCDRIVWAMQNRGVAGRRDRPLQW